MAEHIDEPGHTSAPLAPEPRMLTGGGIFKGYIPDESRQPAPPDPNYQNAYTHAVQEYNKHQPAPAQSATFTGDELCECGGMYRAHIEGRSCNEFRQRSLTKSLCIYCKTSGLTECDYSDSCSSVEPASPAPTAPQQGPGDGVPERQAAPLPTKEECDDPCPCRETGILHQTCAPCPTCHAEEDNVNCSDLWHERRKMTGPPTPADQLFKHSPAAPEGAEHFKISSEGSITIPQNKQQIAREFRLRHSNLLVDELMEAYAASRVQVLEERLVRAHLAGQEDARKQIADMMEDAQEGGAGEFNYAAWIRGLALTEDSNGG